jgi:hypothetical protein
MPFEAEDLLVSRASEDVNVVVVRTHCQLVFIWVVTHAFYPLFRYFQGTNYRVEV